MTATIRYSIVLAVAFVIGLAFAVYDGYSAVASTGILSEFQNAYLIRTWAVTLLRFAPLLSATAGIVTFSIALSSYDLGGNGALIAAVRPLLILVVVLGILYGLWVSLFAPGIEFQRFKTEYRSDVAEYAWSRAEEARDAGDLREAERYALVYRSVVGETAEVEDFLADVRTQYDLQRRSERLAAFSSDDDPVTATRRAEVRELGVPELLEKAREFYDAGEYFSAHFYATRAVEMTDGRRDAASLQADALNAIQGGAFDIEDEDDRSLYRDKMAAYQRFTRGDPIDNPEALIDAYYQFQALSERAPDDPDIQRYTTLAREAVDQVAFFEEDAARYAGDRFRGHIHIVFVNRNDGAVTEYVTAERIVESPQGVYFYDIEVYREGNSGVLHFSAPYGKRVRDDLFFRALTGDPNNPFIGPQRIAGTSTSSQSPPGSIQLHYDTADIVRLSSDSTTFPTLSLAELFGIPRVLAALGQPKTEAIFAVSRRLLAIVGFFMLTFLSIGVGWRYRGYYIGRPPIMALLAIPVFPAVLWWGRELPALFLRIIVHGLAERFTPGITLVIVIAVLFLALIASVAYLARQRITA